MEFRKERTENLLADKGAGRKTNEPAGAGSWYGTDGADQNSTRTIFTPPVPDATMRWEPL